MSIYKSLDKQIYPFDIKAIDITKVRHIRYRGIEIKIGTPYLGTNIKKYFYWEEGIKKNSIDFDRNSIAENIDIIFTSIDRYIEISTNMQMMIDYHRIMSGGILLCESYSPVNKYIRIKYYSMSVRDAIITIRI